MNNTEQVGKFADEVLQSLRVAERAAFELAVEIERDRYMPIAELRRARSVHKSIGAECARIEKLIATTTGVAEYRAWRESVPPIFGTGERGA